MPALPSHEHFWMVCRKPTHPNARTEPKARFASRAAALAEAERLAATTGAQFVLLEAIEIIHPTDAGFSKGLF